MRRLNLTAYARFNREEPTFAEKVLWRELRKGATGFKFRRQQPVGHFILDFYCAEKRLAVEVDGSIHEGAEDLDAWRDEELRKEGIEVLRFKNEQVLDAPSSVAALIRAA